ncbi:uncharacterized protein RCO7_06748 [Rhynchosporium graminicola]|uniref:Uncharacterized protein n=1 Tax=Rhynchosporium graminicola TaxID=2792576 RepID=A0A1E1JXX9_9HELO|nr:uncharacterized protein RCO7_06748 [Rhynchosporium commune]
MTTIKMQPDTIMTAVVATTTPPRPSYRKHTRALSRDLGFKTIPMFEMPVEFTIPENTVSGSYTNMLNRARGGSSPPPPSSFLRRTGSCREGIFAANHSHLCRLGFGEWEKQE